MSPEPATRHLSRNAARGEVTEAGEKRFGQRGGCCRTAGTNRPARSRPTASACSPDAATRSRRSWPSSVRNCSSRSRSPSRVRSDNPYRQRGAGGASPGSCSFSRSSSSARPSRAHGGALRLRTARRSSARLRRDVVLPVRRAGGRGCHWSCQGFPPRRARRARLPRPAERAGFSPAPLCHER